MTITTLFGTTPARRHFNLALLALEALAIVAVAAVTAQYFAAPDTARIVAAMAVAYAVPRCLLTRSRHCTRGSLVVLYVVGLGLMALAIYNMWSWTVMQGCTLEAPHINSDGNNYYKCALHYFNGSAPVQRHVHYYGLPAMIYLTWTVLGVSLVWPMAVNYMLTLLSIITFGFMACRLLAGRTGVKSQRVMLITMLMISLLTFYLSQGVMLQKEALNYIGMAMVGYVLAGLAAREKPQGVKQWKEVLIFFLGAGMLISTRGNMGYFVAAGVVLAVAGNVRGNWKMGGILMLITLVLFYLGTEVFAREAYFFHQVRIVVNTTRSADRMSEMYIIGPTQQPLRDLLGDYFYYPLWRKVALLPITSSSLYLIPFPWLRGNYDINNIMSRVTWTWYAIGGLSLFYYLFIGWRRGRGLGWIALWPVVCFLAIAYSTGGAMARYVLPLQPLFAVVATYVLCLLHDKKWRHSLSGFMAGYALLLAAALFICYNLQMHYIQPL